MQVRVAAGGEGPAQVQRHGRAVVGTQQPVRIRRPGPRGELEPVHRVAAVSGQLDAVPDLRRPGTRLGELPGHPADLDDRDAGPVGEHHGHLEQGLELGADRRGGRAGERLRAVAALEHERLAVRDRREPLGQQVALPGEDQRRKLRELGRHGGEPVRIWPLRLLARRMAAPARQVRTEVAGRPGEPGCEVEPALGRGGRCHAGAPSGGRRGRVAVTDYDNTERRATGGRQPLRRAAPGGRQRRAAPAGGRGDAGVTWRLGRVRGSQRLR